MALGWEPCCWRRAGDLSRQRQALLGDGGPFPEHVLGLPRAVWTLGESGSGAFQGS